MKEIEESKKSCTAQKLCMSMHMTDNTKVAVVTGASRGIGNAIATRLAKDGFAVVATGKSAEEEVKENFAEIKNAGVPFLYISGDLSNSKDRERTINTVLDKFGRIDILVNNAGVAPKTRMDVLETTEESFDFVMNLNVKATYFMTQMVANEMVKEVEAITDIQPKIINISSVSAYTSSVNRGEYCVSKAGIAMITKLFADRLAQYGINVYEIRPGIIATDMTSGVKEKYDKMISGGLTPIKRWGQPEDVANMVSAICSGLMNFSTGEVLNVDGGFHIRRL